MVWSFNQFYIMIKINIHCFGYINCNFKGDLMVFTLFKENYSILFVCFIAYNDNSHDATITLKAHISTTNEIIQLEIYFFTCRCKKLTQSDFSKQKTETIQN